MNIEEIMQILPHRYPFLLVDRIIKIVPGQQATGLKNITINEPYFAGHFPGHPVVPGVLLIEAMAQVGACALLGMEEYQDCLPFLAGVDRARFKRPALPGDTLHITTELLKIRGSFGKGKGQVKVGEEVICAAEFMFALSRG